MKKAAKLILTVFLIISTEYVKSAGVSEEFIAGNPIHSAGAAGSAKVPTLVSGGAEDWEGAGPTGNNQGCLACLPAPCQKSLQQDEKVKFPSISTVLTEGQIKERVSLLSAINEVSISLGSDLSAETTRAIQILNGTHFTGRSSSLRKLAEAGYALVGMVAGAGVTWNAYSATMLSKYFGIPDTYDQYTPNSGLSAEKWILMIGLNVNTDIFLFTVNGSQMHMDASDLFDRCIYSRPYQWGTTPETGDIVGQAMYYAKNIPARIIHLVLEMMRPTLPRVTHWSEYFVDPLLSILYALNISPEVSLVFERSLNRGNFNTVLGIPLAILQRWNEQSRRLSTALHENYYMRLAKWASSEEVNEKREFLASIMVNTMKKLRYGELSSEEIETLYQVLFNKNKDESSSPRIVDNRTISDVGRLALIASYGASAPASYDEDYKEPIGRKITHYTGLGIGLAGSISSAIVIQTTLEKAMLGLGFEQGTAEISGVVAGSFAGVVRGFSGGNAASNYIKQMYDSVTKHEFYKKTPHFNEGFSDVIYGRQETSFLLANLMEGCYWSLIYWALSEPALEEMGIGPGLSATLIAATVLTQGTFEAMESSDDLIAFQHLVQKGRVVQGGCMDRMSSCSSTIWDILFGCCRSRTYQSECFGIECSNPNCCTPVWARDTTRKELKNSIHLFKILRAIREQTDFVEVAKPEIVEEFYDVMVKRNPLLKRTGTSDDSLEKAEEGKGGVNPLLMAVHAASGSKSSALDAKVSELGSRSAFLSSFSTSSASAGGTPARPIKSVLMPMVVEAETIPKAKTKEGFLWGRGSLCAWLSAVTGWA